MLFNSFEFIFGLLPISVLLYFLAARYSRSAAIWVLVLVSLFFYLSWRPADGPLFLSSLLANFAFGRYLNSPAAPGWRRGVFWLAVVANLSLLALYKYGAFLVTNLNALSGLQVPVPALVLPLGISFFTFTQITYLVDSYRIGGGRYSLGSYALFVSFFPHLLAGPILHHGDMMPQFAATENKQPRVEYFWRGLTLFCLGLSKKVLLADPLGTFARAGFDGSGPLGFLEAWLATLAYTFQIYFDFSGYTDMAIGAALVFNIKLPFNFNSPYRALDIQSFWRRWHITLGAFFRDYVYVPLGGNRRGYSRTLLHLFSVALLSGLWHGAGWSFVLWGALHGGAMVLHSLWKQTGLRLPSLAAWSLLFLFITLSWVPFRSGTAEKTNRMLAGLTGRNGVTLPVAWKSASAPAARFIQKAGLRFGSLSVEDAGRLLAYLALGFLIVLWPFNSNRFADFTQPIALCEIAGIALLATWSIVNLNRVSEFIYFNF